MDGIAELVLWTAGSMVLWVIATQVASFAARRPASVPGRFRIGWSGNPIGAVLLFLVRLIFYLLIPYLALLRHVLSPVVIGLSGTETGLPWWNLGWKLANWAGAFGWVTGLGGIAAAACALGWWNAHRATLAPDGAGGEFPSGGLAPAPAIFNVVLESIFAEIHWAFYRAVPLAIISDPYWATLVGGALVMAEWAVDPAWRASLRGGAGREARLMQLGWLALSTVVFVMARNVWVMLFLHIVLAWALGQWVALLAARRAVVGEQH